MKKGVEFIADVGMKKPNENSTKKCRYFCGKCLHCGKEFESQARYFKNLKSCCKCASGLRPKSIYNRPHGLRGHPLYDVWAGMKARCSNKNHYGYKRYGGRGIKVCETWEKNFEFFYNWSLLNGYRKGLQLDRVDNDGDYEPENCRWVTRTVNMNNADRSSVVNKTGFTGVIEIKKSKRFISGIGINGGWKYLGCFATAEEASAAYEMARKEKLLKIME